MRAFVYKKQHFVEKGVTCVDICSMISILVRKFNRQTLEPMKLKLRLLLLSTFVLLTLFALQNSAFAQAPQNSFRQKQIAKTDSLFPRPMTVPPQKIIPSQEVGVTNEGNFFTEEKNEQKSTEEIINHKDANRIEQEKIQAKPK